MIPHTTPLPNVRGEYTIVPLDEVEGVEEIVEKVLFPLVVEDKEKEVEEEEVVVDLDLRPAEGGAGVAKRRAKLSEGSSGPDDNNDADERAETLLRCCC